MLARTEFHHHKLDDLTPEQLLHVIDGASMEHTILSGNRCSAEIRQLRGTSLSIHIGNYSFPAFVRGQFEAGKLCIGLGRAGIRPTWVNGAHIDDASIHIHTEGSEILYRSATGATWYGITITREALQQAARVILERELDLPEDRTKLSTLDLPGPSAGRMLNLLDSLSGEHLVKGHFNGIDWEEQLLERLVFTLADGENGSTCETRHLSEYRHELVWRADHLIRRSLDDRYSSERICSALGVSERVLQLYFRETFGISPKQWFSCLALNRVRSRLLQSPPSPGVIAEIAMEAGFEHLGRFSCSYRKVFHESPSHTLRRSPALLGNRPRES